MEDREEREGLPSLSQQTRMEHVLRLLVDRDSVQVAELAELFSISEVTVRSDLTTMAEQGLVARVRGGVRALRPGNAEVGFDLRLRLEAQRKQAIARHAAAMVDEGEAVAIDASTTGWWWSQTGCWSPPRWRTPLASPCS
jgi:DeoR/GlpR family transcriptional regulator of sugar metabolism